jgi:hypothetical protein
MPDKNSICNEALLGLGAAPIQHFSEQTKTGVLCRTFWGTSLDEVLRAHPWNFAIKRVRLSPLAGASVFGYVFRFQKPSDCLRVVEVSASDYRLEGREILANEGSICLRYVSRVEDETLLDSLCVAALVCSLRWKLAFPVVQSTTLKETALSDFAQVLAMARNVDAQEEPAEEFEESSLITVRR